MTFKITVIATFLASAVAMPALAQSPANPWQVPEQNPYMRGHNMAPWAMSPEQMQAMRRQKHEAMMQRKGQMAKDMDCQHGGKGMQGQHAGGQKHGEKHGKQHGKHHGQKHQAHRQQMEQRLQRIEDMLQQLLDQQANAATAQQQ